MNKLKRRHDELMGLYASSNRDYDPQLQSSDKLTQSDLELLTKYHEFIRDDEKDSNLGRQDWGIRMARRYYDKLFKEYALVDLRRYKENKIGTLCCRNREYVFS